MTFRIRLDPSSQIRLQIGSVDRFLSEDSLELVYIKIREPYDWIFSPLNPATEANLTMNRAFGSQTELLS